MYSICVWHIRSVFLSNRLLWQKKAPSMLHFLVTRHIASQREKPQRIGVCREVAIMSERPLSLMRKAAQVCFRQLYNKWKKKEVWKNSTSSTPTFKLQSADTKCMWRRVENTRSSRFNLESTVMLCLKSGGFANTAKSFIMHMPVPFSTQTCSTHSILCAQHTYDTM